MGSSDQQWLYRQGDLVLGPANEAQVIEKIYAGELGAKSEIQAMGSGVFKRVEEVNNFRVALAKADAKRRVDDAMRVRDSAEMKKRVKMFSAFGVVLLAVGVGVAFLGSYLAVHAPTKTAEAQDELISMSDFKIKAARKEDELVDLPGQPRRPRNPGSSAPSGGSRAAKAGNEPEEPDGLQVNNSDRAAIQEVVERNKRNLNPCLVKAARPNEATRIPLEFAVSNGKVSQLWVENKDFAEGELKNCLLAELQRWKFKTATGSSESVRLEFTIGKKPPAQ